MAQYGYLDSSNPFDSDGASGTTFHSGPGVGHRMTPREIKAQQQRIIEGMYTDYRRYVHVCTSTFR